ncbi:MAG: exonuclease domain-containing protein [Prevotella sp.]|nr:3'-5' exonuclease [Bacteroidales bacterium]MDY3355664.1 exonuclease domain-containing protein [Prevotella sp.]MCI7039190.1 3'-5' exonuclease [Bacteroidales bacterium]MCI7561526.1 3'-5' exonuclease [Bacteroidales bacterium]MCI7762989.1 3'-5' exonuclease [Bacteroidales bacterium]
MKPNLTRPLIIFDLETTGLDLSKDSIIQISYIKAGLDGSEVSRNIFINPGRPIPALIQELTSITDEMVKTAPKFKDIAKELEREFAGCDFAGYNSNKFDIPMLAEEFLRSGIDFDFSKVRLIDASVIFRKMERRNLAAAYKFYCGRKLEDDFQAHLADQDTMATWKVLQAELDMYAPEKQEEEDRKLENDMDVIAEFCKPDSPNVDFAGRIAWGTVKGPDGKPLLNPDGSERQVEVFNFGKYKDIPVAEVLRRDPGYYSWILSNDFTLNTKQILTRIRLREFNNRR